MVAPTTTAPLGSSTMPEMEKASRSVAELTTGRSSCCGPVCAYTGTKATNTAAETAACTTFEVQLPFIF